MARTTSPLPEIDTGTTLRAVQAVHSGQETYNRAQVEYLLHLAYRTGRLHAAAEDFAEVAACWSEYADPAVAREQRVAERLAEMDQDARRLAKRERRPYREHPGGPVDWETGEPVAAGVRLVAA